jgi:hypothetical protein
MTKLVLKSPGTSFHMIELKQGVTHLGRDEGNDYVFDDPAISERHCEVLVAGDRVLVRDLGSTNGTFVDGHLVTESQVRDRQTLRIGPIEMMLDAPEIHLSIPPLPSPQALGLTDSDETDAPADGDTADGSPGATGTRRKGTKIGKTIAASTLPDGHDVCQIHRNRHAVWRCKSCGRFYCNQCVRRHHRIDGVNVRLCPSCSNHCEPTLWSQLVKRRKKSILGKLAEKMKSRFNQTTRLP